VIACHTHLAPVAWAVAKVAGGPYAVWCHGFEAWGRLRRSVVFGLRRAALVGTHSTFGARAVEAAAGLPAGNVRVVAPGLPSGFVVPPGRPEGCSVLTVARLEAADAYKGVDTLILAWPLVLAQAPEAELIVVGDGSDRQRLEAIAEALGIESRVRFLGRVSDGDLGRAYATARIFALPGRHSVGPDAQGEGFGIVFIEAGAASLPVVAGRGAGTDDAVAHGVSGLLVDPKDLHDVAGAIIQLLENPELARRMGEGGRERAAGLFSESRFKREVGGLLDELQALDMVTAYEESSVR
jgi:phosphatidylinositol alpha-1,6-mannosyltransferase